MAIKATKISPQIQNKRVKWARLLIEMCQYCKVNILKSNIVSHHGSLGDIYSFGYQGLFKLVGENSVGLYGVKKVHRW